MALLEGVSAFFKALEERPNLNLLFVLSQVYWKPKQALSPFVDANPRSHKSLSSPSSLSR